ncbi:hypothetical protein HQ545_07070 [Candidatus Woesearchaeota archaeon]|nr:hypothetical protein [Candidatus Woesearchaeota archaeon]
MDEEETKKSKDELEVKKKELDSLKVTLHELNTDKESWFEKKRQASKAISDSVQSIRDAKSKRNTFTKQVRDSKKRRQELNTLLKDKQNELLKLQQEKKEVSTKLDMRFDPSKIQTEIEELEFKIETEAMPFNIEQRVMKKIAEKKKLLNQSKDVSSVFGNIHELRKDIDRIRKKADETHKKVQLKAETSQKYHEELIEASKDIKDLRTNEDEALKNFVEAKTKYNDQNDIVKKKLDEIYDIRSKVEGVDLREKKKAKKDEESKLIEKERDVEEKIKKGMKLTTDDLLAFQAKEHMNMKPSSKPRNEKKNEKKDVKNNK